MEKKVVFIIENDFRNKKEFVDALAKSGTFRITFGAFSDNTVSKIKIIGANFIFINCSSLSPLFKNGNLKRILEEILENFPESAIFVSPDGYSYSRLKNRDEPLDAFKAFRVRDSEEKLIDYQQ